MDRDLTFLRIELTGKLLQLLEQRNFLIAKGKDISDIEKAQVSELNNQIKDLENKIDQVKYLLQRNIA